MSVQDDKRSPGDDIELLLREASARWTLLCTNVKEAEETFLTERSGMLRKWFTLDEAELAIWTEGGLRHTLHDRVQRLVVGPLAEKMRQRVGFTPPPTSEEEEESGIPIEDRRTQLQELLDFWSSRVRPLLDEAKSEDEKLTKKIRKTEKEERAQGIVALGMGDTKKVAALKRTRPAIWEASNEALEKFSVYARKLLAFLEDELTTDVPERLAGAVPSVVSRAVCDWFFQKSLLDHDRLEKWWASTKQGLQQKGVLWQALEEEEGLLLKRIEKGMEEIRLRRSRYSIYATFGGSEVEVLRCLGGSTSARGSRSSSKFEESLVILANVVSEMHSRLKQIRDSAMWHIVDRAQGLHKELNLEEDVDEPSPWPSIGSDEGTDALAEVLVDEAFPESASLIDSALEVRRRIDSLITVITDLQDLPFLQAPGGHGGEDVRNALQEMSRIVVELNEDILVLLDEPTAPTVDTWCGAWGHIGKRGVAERLDQAMGNLSLQRDSDMKPQDRHFRRKCLIRVRGLCVLLGAASDDLRTEVIAPLLVHGSRHGSSASEPVSPAKLRSRRESRRDSRQQDGTATPALSVQDLEIDILSLSMPPSPRQLPMDANGRFTPLAGEGGGAAASGARPSGMRPDTPSTTCEDQSETPSAKVSDGKLISLRPNSAGIRLPPLSPQRSREAW